MPRLRTTARQIADMFRPPFEGLWLLIVLYYGWCFFVYPHSQTLRGNLPDPDDYMYLAQVMDWLKGQSWYDNVQHRLNPPFGTPIQFSRFAEMPMAAFIWLFEKLGLPPRGAATVMALFYPLVLLSGFLFAMKKLAACFVPKDWAGVSAYISLFATGMMFMFMPGHIDHHGLVILLITAVLAFAMRMIEEPGEPRWGIYAGLTLAFALVVALEILPWLLLISSFIGLWATAKGGTAARNGFGFALALYLGSAVFLALTLPPGAWFTPDILAYSVVYVLLTGGIAVSFAGLALTAEAPALLRWLAGAALAGLTGFLFIHRFPELIKGPYGAMDPELARMMLGEIDEAKSLLRMDSGAGFLTFAVHLAGFAVAMPACLYFLVRARGRALAQWALLFILFTAAFLLTFFYQYRFTGMMWMGTIIPLTVLLQRGWKRIGERFSGRRKVFAEIGLLLLAGPLPGVLFPALADSRPFNTGLFLFPVDASVKDDPCDTYVLEHILNDPNFYGDRPRLIADSMGQGPELLFRTDHKVLSAPFHMDVTGNIDATRFFSTPYPSEAERIALRRHIDLVIACRYVPFFYTRPEAAPVPALPENKAGGGGKEGKDGAEKAAAPKIFAPHMIELLMTGHAPRWLKRVYFPQLHNFVIFEVKLPKTPDSSPRK